VGAGADQNYAHGIAAYTSILERPCTLDDAIRQAPDLTARSAENVMRLVLTGQQLAARP
jgi:glycerate kinase